MIVSEPIMTRCQVSQLARLGFTQVSVRMWEFEFNPLEPTFVITVDEMESNPSDAEIVRMIAQKAWEDAKSYYRDS